MHTTKITHTITFHSGVTSCAWAENKFCQFFGTARFGTVGVCMLFNQNLEVLNGWTRRCDQCVKEFG